MIFSLRSKFLIILLVNALFMSGQTVEKSADDLYGSDPLLYNGKFYTYYPPFNTTGTQYFSDRNFNTGSLTLRGIVYNDRQMNYDIYNQQVVLKNISSDGAVNLIVVSDAWFESFNFLGNDFEIFTGRDSISHIYQVIGQGKKRIFYLWYKDLALDSFYGSKNFVFSEPKREMNLFDGQQPIRYTNKHTFVALFDEEIRDALKDYIRQNKINLKRANDESINDLVLYINTLDTK